MNTTTHARSVRPGTQLVALVLRGLRGTRRVPQLLMLSLTMPLAMLVLFSQVFRSIADNPSFPADVSYIDFLTPAMLAVATVMAGTNAGVATAMDHTSGLSDRFAALPMPRWIPGAARTLNEAVFTVGRVAVLVAGAVLLGFEFHGNAVDLVAALVVLVMLAAAMSALFGLIGDQLRRPDVVQFAGMMIMMPFMFISGAFAPLDTMPGWMQGVAEVNPVAHATDAVRAHVLGAGSTGTTAMALAVSASYGVAALVGSHLLNGGRSRPTAAPEIGDAIR
jgi:ABC-2 type transport system permease protein